MTGWTNIKQKGSHPKNLLSKGKGGLLDSQNTKNGARAIQVPKRIIRKGRGQGRTSIRGEQPGTQIGGNPEKQRKKVRIK